MRTVIDDRPPRLVQFAWRTTRVGAVRPTGRRADGPGQVNRPLLPASSRWHEVPGRFRRDVPTADRRERATRKQAHSNELARVSKDEAAEDEHLHSRPGVQELVRPLGDGRVRRGGEADDRGGDAGKQATPTGTVSVPSPAGARARRPSPTPPPAPPRGAGPSVPSAAPAAYGTRNRPPGSPTPRTHGPAPTLPTPAARCGGGSAMTLHHTQPQWSTTTATPRPKRDCTRRSAPDRFPGVITGASRSAHSQHG